MSEYGQSIPPKTFHRTAVAQYTKLGFAEVLCRALAGVGMQFIGGWSSYDILDPANSEKQVPLVLSGSHSTFFFDFPTSEFFTIGTEAYRPCMVVSASVHADAGGASQNLVGELLALRLGVRRADRLLKTDFRSVATYRVGTSNYSVGASNDSWAYYANHELGSFIYDPLWLPYVGAAGLSASYVLKTISNIFVHLGPAGLFIFVGTGQKRTDFGNLLSWGTVFAGARIPGRARIPAQDPNLPRINPTLLLTMQTTDSEWINTTTGQLFNYALGMQHDLKTTVEPVVTELFNLENVEQPFTPSVMPNTLRSPRSVNGSGSHILNRLVAVTRYRRGATGDLFGPVDSQITGSDTRPQWEDAWTALNFRLGDRTAPIGEFVDPVTGTNWFLVYAPNTQMVYGLYYEGNVKISDPVNLNALALQETNEYNLNNGFVNGAAPNADTNVTYSTQGVDNFAAGPADEFLLNVFSSNSNRYKIWVVDPYVAGVDPIDPSDTIYKIAFEAKFEKSTGTSVNPLQFWQNTTIALPTSVITTGGEVLLSIVPTVGATFQPYEIPIALHESNKLVFSFGWTTNFVGTLTGQVATVRDIKVKKYRRV